MKLNRMDLIAKLRAMVDEREAKAADAKAKALIECASAEVDYVRETAGDWGKFADRIRLKLRKGAAITIDDVPENLRDRNWGTRCITVFRPSTVNESNYVPRIENLTRLIAVLESSPDEFVTTAALDRIGAPLRDLMRS